MTAAATPPPDLAARLRHCIQAGAEIAAQIERGQGDGPLSRHFAELSEDLMAGPFRLVVLGLDAGARGRALSLLSGQDFRVLSLHIPDEVGLLDVRFGARGYALESRSGRAEFDRLEPFLDAVRAADLLRDGDPEALLSPVTLRLEGPPGVQGLHVRLPENLRALAKSPRLLGRLAAHSHLLLVAGPPQPELAPDEAQALRDLVEAIPIVQPLVFVQDGHAPARTFGQDRGLLPARELLPACIAEPGQVPRWAREPGDPLRIAAAASFHGSRLRTAFEMLKAELSEDRGQVAARCKALAREQKALEEGQRSRDLRSQVGALRQPVQDQLRALSDQLGEDLRRVAIAGGPLESSVSTAVAQVTLQDLQRTPQGSKVRLGLAEAVVERCRRTLYEELARATRSAAVLLREGAGALEAKLAKSLGEVRRASVGVKLPSLDEDRVRHALKELLRSEIETKAEIDRRGGLKQLAHGRQLVLTLLMTVSLFGSVLPFDRATILSPPVMLPLFLGCVVMSVFTLRRSDRERMEKELERMRDQLHQQLVRRGNDALRELGERTRRHVEDLKEQITRQIDAVAHDTEQQLASRDRDELKELAARARVQEQRRRDLDGLLQRCGELERSVAEVEHDVSAAVQRAARVPATPRPDSGA